MAYRRPQASLPNHLRRFSCRMTLFIKLGPQVSPFPVPIFGVNTQGPGALGKHLCWLLLAAMNGPRSCFRLLPGPAWMRSSTCTWANGGWARKHHHRLCGLSCLQKELDRSASFWGLKVCTCRFDVDTKCKVAQTWSSRPTNVLVYSDFRDWG
jgi:hypothetical protein